VDCPLIIYLHGFCSSPASWKSRLLEEYLAARGLGEHFVCPQLSTVPALAVEQVGQLIEAVSGPVMLVGSSLGGHYANYLAEKYDLPAVLINPATVDRLDLAKFVGDHANFNTGEKFTFTAEHAGQLKAQVTKPSVGRYWLLLERGDEVLDYRQAVSFYLGARQLIFDGGNHSFSRFPEVLPDIVRFAGLPAA
jgi:predicted esterase YcpF (UPF0227 family)